jgi:hypothetical protein
MPGTDDRVDAEFEALWSDDTASLSPGEAHTHYEALVEVLRSQASAPVDVGRSVAIRRIRYRRRDNESTNPLPSPDVLIGFSARRPDDDNAHGGYAESNRGRHIDLCTPTGKVKRAQLTITTLALDVIYRARPGETLLVAMYALSPRIPEYGALLAAARRGVALRVLLDGKLGRRIAQVLAEVRAREHLLIDIKHGYRTMHQKYVVNVDTATVLTGTANMTTDASTRHSEHRIRVVRDAALARRFIADFETIWNRVSAQT